MVISRAAVGMAGVALSMALSSCALVWDIEAADLDTRIDGGADSSDHPLEVPPGACQLTGEECADCVATSCCDQYGACLGDATCNEALITYELCLSAPPAEGASSCAEALGAASSISKALVQCVFFGQCKTGCSFTRLRSPCAEYCSCMAVSCSSASFAQGTCMDTCNTLSAEQLECRAYHCMFAEADPDTHCDHALGLKVCP